MTTSRFRVLPAPIRVPGTCRICGSAKGPVIDTSVEIDYEGSLYICVRCATEIGQTVGLEEPTVEKEEQTYSKAEVNELLVNFNSAISGFTDSWFTELGIFEDTDSGSSDSEKPTGSSEEGVSADSSERPDGVPSDTGDGADDDTSRGEPDLF